MRSYHKKTSKQKLRSQADKLWYLKCLDPQCEVCGCASIQVHHFFPKHLYPELRYDLENGVNLCISCHFKHHHLGDPKIHQTIIKNRGNKWYDNLLAKSKIRKSSFQTVAYYQAKIKELE